MTYVYGKRFGGARDAYHLVRGYSSVAICGRLFDMTLYALPRGAHVCGHCITAEAQGKRSVAS